MMVFKEAIKNNADAIMISHLKIKGYGVKPATLNKKIIDELLINKYQYKGLIITDDLRMRNLKGSIKRRIKTSIDAGNNVLLVKYKKGDINRIYKELYQ